MKHFPEWSLRTKKLLASISAVVLLLAGSQAALTEAGVFSGGKTSSEEAQPQPPDPKRLEVIEELSESLANDLLDLSLATRDRAHRLIAEFFPDELQATPFPSYPLQVQRQLKWIGRHGWTSDALAAAARHSQTPAAQADRSGSADGRVRRLTRKEFLAGWFGFLAHFADIEDVRFKVKRAQFDDSANADLDAKVPTATVGSRGRARVAFFLVGRNTEDQREWTRGTAEVRVRRAQNGRWQFESFIVTALDSMVASTDLFSEVAAPAGVALSRPAYGSSGNTGFVWHGAVAADFDNDGWLDLFVTGPYRNYLYLNNGQGSFRDASEEAGLGLSENAVAPVAFDYDNDGDQDLFISAVGSQSLLENRLVPDGKLAFQDVSSKAGVARVALGFSAAVGDVNGDGWPDVYVTCYNHYGQVMPNSWYRATNGTPNLLFINQGDGRFHEEASRWGVDDRRWSYAAAFADLDGDGRLDLYVANDFGENALFINQGDRFADQAAERGVLDPGYGMGVSFGDYNNDGLLDLHVTNMSSTAGNRILSRFLPDSSPKDNVLLKLAAGNSLYQNRGGGFFRDVTAEAGPFSAGWAWGGGFLDLDNDGWEDLFSPNGFISGKSMKDT
ncbi:MAG: FG-GAP repeat domain-containing protein [Candidatus Acidiferrales bacterium]